MNVSEKVARSSVGKQGFCVQDLHCSGEKEGTTKKNVTKSTGGGLKHMKLFFFSFLPLSLFITAV